MRIWNSLAMQCSACGTPIEPTDATCGACGAAVDRDLHRARLARDLDDPDEFELEHTPLDLDLPPRHDFEHEPVAAVRGTPVGERANFFVRGIAFAIDLLVLALLDGVILAVTLAAIAAAEVVTAKELADSNEIVFAFVQGGALALFVGYFVLLSTGEGQTLGKAAVQIRVERLDGEPVGLVSATVRCLGYALSALPLGIGFLWALGPARRALHDYVAGTVVVRA
jgi:uncharacterized RDD family membrane protein YckC